MKSSLLGTICACALVLITTTTNAAVLPLESRLGGLAYYDPNLNITWAADANINGSDNWDNQVAWVAGLTIGGVSGWRLPSADVNGDNTVVDCGEGGVIGCADNEMGFLYSEEGILPVAPGPFSNIQSSGYWYGTEFAPDPIFAWDFFFKFGVIGILQGGSFKDTLFFAWPVYSGDVSAVPVPAALWLFGSGLLGLVGIARRKKA